MPDANPGQFLSQDAADRTEAVVLEVERALRKQTDFQFRRGPQDRPPLRGILLQDLNLGGTALCEVTVRDPARLVQKFSIVGEITAAGPPAGTFTLGVSGASPAQVTPALGAYSTAAQVQAALQALPAIGPKNVNVTLGLIPSQAATANQPATPTYFPGVWLIEFVGKFLQPQDPPAAPTLTIVPSLTGLTYVQLVSDGWADANTTETVMDAIPIGTPTPMRAGAVVSAIWFPGAGYGVIAAEGREFSAIPPS